MSDIDSTLHRILEHWTDDSDFKEGGGFIELPFNSENFCRENDEIIQTLQQDNARLRLLLERCLGYSGIQTCASDIVEDIEAATNYITELVTPVPEKEATDEK